MSRTCLFLLCAFSSALAYDILDQLCASQISCGSAPSFTVNGYSYSESDFNAISFGDFSIMSGDVEGRVATQGNFDATGGVSIGYSIGSTSLPYSLVVGGDAVFVTGQVYPASAGIFVGRTFTGAANLKAQVTANCSTPGCLNSQFSALHTYFDQISSSLAAKTSNVGKSLGSGGVLSLNCSSSSSFQYVSISAADFSSVMSYSLSNCNSNDIFIFNIQGSGTVLFQGSALPSNSLYNVIAAASVSIDSSVTGTILAPLSDYAQSQGVVIGQVIANNVSSTLQISTPINETSTSTSATTSASVTSTSVSLSSTTTKAATTSTATTSSTMTTKATTTAPLTTASSTSTNSTTTSKVTTSTSGASTSSKPTTSSKTTTGSTSTSTTTSGSTMPSSTTSSSTTGASNSSTSTGYMNMTSTGSMTSGSSSTTGSSCVCPNPPPATSTTGSTTSPASPGSCATLDAATDCGILSDALDGSYKFIFDDYDFIAFGDLTATTGDIEGKAFVAGSVNLGGGFSFAEYVTQNATEYNLIAGSITWQSGSLSGGRAFIASDNGSAPSYLSSSFDGPCNNSNCLSSITSRGKTCYGDSSSTLAAQSDNANYTQSNTGILITCNNSSSIVYVSISGSDISSSTFWSLNNCDNGFIFIINVVGTDDVSFSGGNFPKPDGVVIYNIIGSGRTINVNTAVAGSILAPGNSLNMTGGVIMGKVVVNNAQIVQVNIPDCSGYTIGPATVSLVAPTSVNSASSISYSIGLVGVIATIFALVF